MGHGRTVAVPYPTQRGVAKGAHNPVRLNRFGGKLGIRGKLWATLPYRKQIVRHDLHDYGQQIATEVTAFFAHAADLRPLLDTLEMERCYPASMSMCGFDLPSTAPEWQKRIASLTLVIPSISTWERSAEFRKYFGRVASAGAMSNANHLRRARPFFASSTENANRAIDAEAVAFSDTQQIAAPQREPTPDSEPLLRLRIPTRLQSIVRDLLEFRVADLSVEAAPQSTRLDHVGLGHILHAEMPDWCSVASTTFWRNAA